MVALFQCQSFLRHGTQQAANAGMGILYIVYRILRGLLHSQIQVKFKMRICLSGVEEETGCVQRNFVQQSDQCDRLAAAFGKLDHFAVTHQHDHLHQYHIQTGCICTQCGQGCFQTRHIAVVVCTQNVNCLVKLPHHQLIIVVSNVRYHISGDPVGTYQHEVLVRTEIRCLEPDGTLLLIGIATLGQFVYHPLYLSILMQGAFAEPVVIDNAVLLQIPFQTGDVLRQCKCHQCVPSGLGIGVDILVTVFSDKVFRMLCNVCPVIGIFRHFHRGVKVLEIPHFQRSGKLFDLVAGIIDIEFPLYVPACPRQNLCKAVAQCTAAGIAHMHWACGIGRNKLHHHLRACALIAASITVAFAHDVLQNFAEPPMAQSEINKTRTRYLTALKIAVS